MIEEITCAIGSEFSGHLVSSREAIEAKIVELGGGDSDKTEEILWMLDDYLSRLTDDYERDYS